MDNARIYTAQEIINKRRALWERYKDIERDKEFINSISLVLTKSSPQGLQLRKEIKEYPEKLIEMVFVIVDKNLQTVPFFLNEVQQELAKIINQDRKDFKEGKCNFLEYLILKGRQQGFTSFVTAYQLVLTITVKNFSGFTVADNSDNTNTIFEDKAKYPYSMLPELLKPTEKFNTRKEMLFQKLNSKWRCATAGNKDIGRSKTVNFFHASECAFWTSISTIIAALGQALTKGHIKILESTANGYTEFRQLWRAAEKGENNFKPLFFQWWRTSEYRLSFENEKIKEDFIQAVNNKIDKIHEKMEWLHSFYKLDWEQLYWYFHKFKELDELLSQEYPCTPEEAFIASGNPVFDNARLEKRLAFLDNHYKFAPLTKGYFTFAYKGEHIIDKTIKFHADPNGPVWIFEKPKQYTPYVLGGDTAEGGEDYCTATVLDNTNLHQVATYQDRTDTGLYAQQMYCLGKLYNYALIGIEANFDSHPIKELERLGYKNQYMREAMDTITGEIQYKYGWWTSGPSRNHILGTLIDMVRTQTHLFSCVRTIKEMLVFIKNPKNGKLEAATGEHDDLVMCTAIALQISGQQGNKRTIPETVQVGLPKALQDEPLNFLDVEVLG